MNQKLEYRMKNMECRIESIESLGKKLAACGLHLAPLIFFLSSCKTNTEIVEEKSDTLKYAQGFSVTVKDNCKWVEVKQPFQGATSGYHYLLVHLKFLCISSN